MNKSIVVLLFKSSYFDYKRNKITLPGKLKKVYLPDKISIVTT